MTTPEANVQHSPFINGVPPAIVEVDPVPPEWYEEQERISQQERAAELAKVQAQVTAMNEACQTAGVNPIAVAFRALANAMQSDPGYAWSWHCNIAMAAFDEGLRRCLDIARMGQLPLVDPLGGIVEARGIGAIAPCEHAHLARLQKRQQRGIGDEEEVDPAGRQVERRGPGAELRKKWDEIRASKKSPCRRPSSKPGRPIFTEILFSEKRQPTSIR